MDVILCFGGNVERNRTAAALALSNPGAAVLVTSEGAPDQVARIYSEAGVDGARVFYDFAAWDTLTNLTLTQPWILRRRCRKLALVSDQFHMRRIRAIADVVYCLKGVALSEFPHPSAQSGESDALVKWDRWRATWWKLTGRTIENGDRPGRMVGIDAARRQAMELGLQVTG